MKNAGSTVGVSTASPDYPSSNKGKRVTSKAQPPSCKFTEDTRVKPYYTGKCKDVKQAASSSTDGRDDFRSKKDDGKKDNKGKIRMPQRKGGLQLWQFLYALLEDKNEQHSDLIEWTQNRKELEFRLNDPEAIALWWGIIKHRANMTYERLSRSLRYYYDRGILKKMGGERYLYRFCIDPEEMYRHIGLSDSRPILKAMPLSVTKGWPMNSKMLQQTQHMPDSFVYPDYIPMPMSLPPPHPSQLPPPPPYPGYHFQSSSSPSPYHTAGPCSAGQISLDFYHHTEQDNAAEQNFIFGQLQHDLAKQSYHYGQSHVTVDPMQSYGNPLGSSHESNLPPPIAAVGPTTSPVMSYPSQMQQLSTSIADHVRAGSVVDQPYSDSDSEQCYPASVSTHQHQSYHPMVHHNANTTNITRHNDYLQQSPASIEPASLINGPQQQLDSISCSSNGMDSGSELDDIIPLLESIEESAADQQANNSTSPVPPCTSSATVSPKYPTNIKPFDSHDGVSAATPSTVSPQSSVSFVYSSCSITQLPTSMSPSNLRDSNLFNSTPPSSWIGGKENVW